MYKHTYNTQPSKGQWFAKPSQTIQGQTLSIAEMLQRVQNGIPVQLNSLEYGEDEDPQPKLKDLTDIDDIVYQVSTFQQKLDDSKKAYAKAKAEKTNAEKNVTKAEENGTTTKEE